MNSKATSLPVTDLRGPNSFNFMQFLGEFGKIICCQPPPPPPESWCPHLGEILDPPLVSCSIPCISGVGEGLPNPPGRPPPAHPPGCRPLWRQTPRCRTPPLGCRPPPDADPSCTDEDLPGCRPPGHVTCDACWETTPKNTFHPLDAGLVLHAVFVFVVVVDRAAAARRVQ